MKKLQVLTVTAGILLTIAGPASAAQRVVRGFDAYASGAVTTDRSGAYYFGPQDAQARASAAPYQAETLQAAPQQYNRGQSLPYSDRAYGAPDTW